MSGRNPRLREGIVVDIGEDWRILQDDGTYIHYLFWWDSHGKYRQNYVSGGHIIDQSMTVGRVIINMESV